MERDDVDERADENDVEERADERSGTGGADSPEEVVGIDEEVVQPEKDPDEGPPGERGED